MISVDVTKNVTTNHENNNNRLILFSS